MSDIHGYRRYDKVPPNSIQKSIVSPFKNMSSAKIDSSTRVNHDPVNLDSRNRDHVRSSKSRLTPPLTNLSKSIGPENEASVPSRRYAGDNRNQQTVQAF